MKNNRKVYRDYWWQHAEKRPALRKAVADLDRILVVALVSRTVMPVGTSTGQVFSHMLGVFSNGDPGHLALLSSGIHYTWAVARASTLETRIRYTPSDVFETLPLPDVAGSSKLTRLGELLDVTRAQTMMERQLGLTKLYNAVHDSSVSDRDVQRLRDIHEQIDQAVAEAYGWSDLDLTHSFQQTRQGCRHTLNLAVQTEVLDRILELNHTLYVREEKGYNKMHPLAKLAPAEDALF